MTKSCSVRCISRNSLSERLESVISRISSLMDSGVAGRGLFTGAGGVGSVCGGTSLSEVSELSELSCLSMMVGVFCAVVFVWWVVALALIYENGGIIEDERLCRYSVVVYIRFVLELIFSEIYLGLAVMYKFVT